MSSNNPHLTRRQQLYTQVEKCDFIVLTAHRLQQRNHDSAYKFRQDSSFLYYTGLTQPDLVLVADLNLNQEWLILPTLSQQQTVFDGGLNHTELSRLSGLEVLDQLTGWRRLKTNLKSNSQPKIGTLQPTKQNNLNLNDAGQRLTRRLRGMTPKSNLIDLTPIINRQRAIKSPLEIKHIQRAVDITATVLETVRSQLSGYKFEYEIEADITQYFRRQNALHAYEPIVASGRNALTLHYIDNSAQINQNDLILMDVGAEVEGYAADITRTYPASGQYLPRAAEVVAAVREIQTYAIKLIQPDFSLIEYVKLTDEFSRQAIVNLGLDPKKSKEFLPHAISHGLGLDVHDRLSHDKFKAGMVLTVEPGIYIDKESIGVRIEDDILVTNSGAKVLSAQLI